MEQNPCKACRWASPVHSGGSKAGPLHICALGLLCLLALLGCGDDPVGPARSSLVGEYAATVFTLTTGAGTVDMLQDGWIVMSLSENGTTSGSLRAHANGEEINADLTGTWTYNRAQGIVTLQQAADTFLGDTPLAVSKQGAQVELTGSYDLDGGGIQIVLERD